MVGSLTLTTGDTSYISQTVIDGNQNGNVVKIVNGEDSTTVLCGFTITNGQNGSGIVIVSSNIKLSNLYIRNNFNYFSGGGVFCVNSNIILENAVVCWNRAGDVLPIPVSYSGGSFYFLDSYATLVNVIVSHNGTYNPHVGEGGSGGGIYFSDSTNYVIFDPINRCNIYNNYHWGSGTGCDLYSESDSIISVVVDTFTVLNPDTSHAYPLNKFTFDILHDTSGNPTKIGKTTNIPLEFTLYQNYPNPFNPLTKIKYTLPKSEKVKIEVFNLLGQKIETILNKQMPAGSHEVEFTAKDLPSGVYLYRIEAGKFQEVKKMIHLK